MILADIFTFCADTCRRGHADSVAVDETPPGKRWSTSEYHTNKTGGVHDVRQQFDFKMATVMGLRGMERSENFELATKVGIAGNFYDIVYTAGGRWYFLHLKHTENPKENRLKERDLRKLLQKSFKSYCDVKHGDNFKDIPFDNSQFIIYTNKELTPALLEHKRKQREDDIFFKTCDKGEIFSFFQEDKENQIDIYKLLTNELQQSKEFRELMIEFLNKLIMVTGQKGQHELDKVIAEEITKHDVARVDNEVFKTEILDFKTRVELWCRDKKEKMTATMFRNWLQEAKTKACAPVVRSLFKSCTKKLSRTGIKFSDDEVSRLQIELSDKPAVHLRSDALTLCSILLMECVLKPNCIFVTFESLQSNKNMLLHAWLGGHWEWLIVFCDSAVEQSDISNTCLDIYENIRSVPLSKRVIILTACSVQQISNFIPIEHIFNFEQLSKKSQEILLDKKIYFQGCEVTMRSVLQRHGNVQHVLGPELVTDLITVGTAVKIGSTLQVNEDYYAPRVLERYLWLQPNVLRTSNDVFAVSGTANEDLLAIVPSGKTVEDVCVAGINNRDFTQNMRGRIILMPKADAENCFLEICKKIQGKPLHWVELKNGGLMWKMSRGGTEMLLDYIDADKTRADMQILAEWVKGGSCEVNEESIWDLDERTVLVVAEPGMGKSSTTTHVAWNTKLADPTSWVVRINWNDHTWKLQELDAAKFKLDSLVEFLCSAAFSESKYIDINRNLLKQALQNSGNVTVLMDGFDEISPIHADKAAVILSELLKTKVRRVWVTSRPVEKERLERKLSVISFGMKRLSKAYQEEMLRYLWKYKAEEVINYVLLSVNESVHDENFTGCPLYIKMIATVCEMEMETNLKSENWQWPKIDLVNMYEVFVERKLHIYLTEKQNADITNSSVLDNLEDLKQTLFNKFENCALVAILPATVLESLHDRKIEEEIQPFLAKVQAGEDKTGIVTNVVAGKPHFVYRTFGDYFTARWFSRNFQDNRSVLERILFDHKFRVMTDIFDRMLARGCPLHYAVLQKDIERFETLLEEGSDVNAVDMGGRNVMHIIATRQWMEAEMKNIISKCRGSLDITDSVLQWTPLLYAKKSGNKYTVEELLKNNVDRSIFDLIGQRAHVLDYINLRVTQSDEESNDKEHESLPEYLCNIDKNIHQTSSTVFPAVQGEQLSVDKSLIEPGANCNTRYSDGKKPLFHADTQSSLGVRTLKEGVASLDVQVTRGK